MVVHLGAWIQQDGIIVVGIPFLPWGQVYTGQREGYFSVLGHWLLSALGVFVGVSEVLAIALLHCFCDCKRIPC